MILSGTEATRPVWAFAGLQPSIHFKLEEIESYPGQPPKSFAEVRSTMAAYANAKLIGGLYLSQVAKEQAEKNKKIYFATVSPGGAKTDVYNSAPEPLPTLMNIPGVFTLMTLVRAAHDVADAAARYVLAVTSETFEQDFPSGAVVGGPMGITWLGTAGPLVNQKDYSPYYEDAEMQKEAARVVRPGCSSVMVFLASIHTVFPET